MEGLNCRLIFWWDGNISTKEGTDLESVFSCHGLHHFIIDQTAILPQYPCIDPIFIEQPNLVIDWGVHFSLHTNCHHQINHRKLNLKIVLSPSCEHLVWNYKQADMTEIRKALDLVNWDLIFHNKTVHDEIFAFDQVLLNIFTCYLPNKYKSFDDKDPLWINDHIKSKIQQKDFLLKQYVKNSKTAHDNQNLKFAIEEVSDYLKE